MGLGWSTQHKAGLRCKELLSRAVAERDPKSCTQKGAPTSLCPQGDVQSWGRSLPCHQVPLSWPWCYLQTECEAGCSQVPG